VQWLDPQHQPVSTPIYIGKMKPGALIRYFLYFRNLEQPVENIRVSLDKPYASVVRAPENLTKGQVGQIVIDIQVPLAPISDPYIWVELVGLGLE